MSKTHIEPKKIYNLTEIREGNLFPWLNQGNPAAHRNAVIEDMLGGNILKAKIAGSGRGRNYKIIGKNIIKYLEAKSHATNKKPKR
jgi:hypothetical protein